VLFGSESYRKEEVRTMVATSGYGIRKSRVISKFN
jgi:hypothetical protein